MNKILLSIYLCAFSCASAKLFSFGTAQDVDIFVRESENSQCQWFNSGILSWFARRMNESTYCRCRDINMYECRTYIQRSNSTGAAGDSNSTTTSVAPGSNSTIDLHATTGTTSTGNESVNNVSADGTTTTESPK